MTKVFVTVSSRFSPITPTLKYLQWLPVKQRIIFKTLELVYKYLASGKPKYFALYTSAVKTKVATQRCS